MTDVYYINPRRYINKTDVLNDLPWRELLLMYFNFWVYYDGTYNTTVVFIYHVRS